MAQDKSSQLESLRIDRSEPEETRSGGLSLGLILIIVVLFSGLSAGGAWWATSNGFLPNDENVVELQPQTQTTSPQTGETAAAPRTRAPRGALVASGYVVARRQATVSAEITGRITEVIYEEGAEVVEGQILARLDDERVRFDLETAKARAAAAKASADVIAADLKEARRVLSRTSRLSENSFSSEADVTLAEARVENLAAQLSRAQSEAQSAEIDVERQADLVDRHLIRAPFSGVIIAKAAQAGEIVSPVSAGGGFTRTGVYTIVDMDSLEIEVDVNEGYIDRVRAGQNAFAVLDAYSDWRIPAHVEAIIPTADRSRATIKVRIGLDEKDGRVLPDMAAAVTFVNNDE